VRSFAARQRIAFMNQLNALSNRVEYYAHTVTYYICGWSYPFGNTSKPGSCSSGFPGSQVTVTVTAPPPTVSITGNGQSNPNSITVIPGQTVHLVATSDPSGSYIVH
jgi:hypothetical protein